MTDACAHTHTGVVIGAAEDTGDVAIAVCGSDGCIAAAAARISASTGWPALFVPHDAGPDPRSHACKYDVTYEPFCVVHDCGATDDVRCGRNTCPHCDGIVTIHSRCGYKCMRRCWEWEVVEHDGPVLVGINDNFYSDPYQAAEDLWDGGHNVAWVVAQPCKVHPAYTPDLRAFVNETWAENYEEWDDCVSKELGDLLDQATALAVKQAPTVWTPINRQIVKLPVTPCPDCGNADQPTGPLPTYASDPECVYCGR